MPTSLGPGTRGAESDRARTLLHVGVLDHGARRRVGQVVDAGDARVLVDLRLGVPVRLGRPVPVVVVLGEIEADGRERRDLRGGAHRIRIPVHPVQLVARQLDHEHVEPARIADRVEHRHADVARGSGAQPAGDQHRRGQLRRRGLAVRAGDADPLGGGAVGARAPCRAGARPARCRPRSGCRAPPPRAAAGGRGGSPARRSTQFRVELEQLGRGAVVSRALRRTTAPITASSSRCWSLALPATTSTPAPSSTSVSAAANPVTPEPEHGDPQAAPVGVPAGEGCEIGHG